MVSLSTLKKVPRQIKSKKRGIVSQIYNNVIEIIAVMPEFAFKAIQFPFVLFLKHFYATLIILLITFFLFSIREFFFEMAPIVSKYLDEILAGINILVWELKPTATEEAEAGVMGALKDAAFTATLMVLDAWVVTHEHQVSNFLLEVPQECASYSSAWATLQKIAQRAGGKSVCEVSRFLLPVPWLHNSFDAVAGWISTADDVQLSTECKSSPPVDKFCTFLASGYIFLELIIPIYIGLLFLTNYWDYLKEIVQRAVNVVILGVKLPLKVLKRFGQLI